jgi:superfamily II RNA helicase
MEGSDDRLTNLVQASLRQYQMKGAMRRAKEELEELEVAIADVGLGEVETELSAYYLLQAELADAEKEQKRAKNARTKNPRSRDVIRRHELAKVNRNRLTKAVRAHPAHGRAIVAEHEDPERVALLRRVNKLRSIVRQAELECAQDAAQTAQAVRSVLARLGYMDKRGLTRKARGLREIVAPSGIVLSELYERGVFGDLDAAELAEVVSWFASDVKRRRENTYRQSRHLATLRHRARDVFVRIAALEEAEGIELVQGPSEWFFGVALAWCRGDSLGKITERVEMAEGDIVSVLNKTVDLLDQFEGMLFRYDDRRLLARAAEARRLLVRGLVAMVRSEAGAAARSFEPARLR